MKKIFVALLLTSLSLPSLVLGFSPSVRNASSAETHTNENNSLPGKRYTATSTKPLTDFCSQIDQILVAINGKVLTHENKDTDIMAKKIEKHDDTRTQIDTLHKQNEVKRKAQLEKLYNRATTTLEKKALANFTVELNQALEKKNRAIDTLLASHYAEIHQVISTRKETVDTAMATLKAEIETAKAKAKSDCINKIQGTTVRIELKNAIKKAQESFRKKVLSLTTHKELIGTKKDTQEKELQEIEATFKKDSMRARTNLMTNLKSAFTSQEDAPVATTTK